MELLETTQSSYAVKACVEQLLQLPMLPQQQ